MLDSEAQTNSSDAAQRTIDLLRTSIIHGDYAPNQRLVEADLSSTFSVSRATVRIALLELENERLVERIPNKGSRVRAISLDEAIEILEVRICVEGLCAARAATAISDDGIAEFRNLRANLAESVAEGNLVEYSRLNRLLDLRILELSGHAVGSRVVKRLYAQSLRHQFGLSFRPQRAKVSVLEHIAIIDAIIDRNPDAARDAVRAHLESVITALREVDRSA